ncbi:ABC transporter substrate-binding protein [Falsirhodobacter deserti]|uniref:ABC transporter substrate-binding protein n=1 Tax=Falsirhodobacter deserti TaxID=1365611 RepID=UPI000FE39738|nr:ABC transporter substrate-binding protein [Falsirhodobacter deserti]
MKKTLTAAALLLASSLTPVHAAETDIRIVLSEELDLIEPCMATRSNIGRVILQNISETLTEYDTRDGKGITPRLATSWEQTDNGWRFHLREDVNFSDGSTFDARDVKHSFDRAMSSEISCETPRYFGGMTVEATVVDDHTIDFTADPVQPILPLLLSLVTIVPEETPVEFTRNPVGTGPYELTEWKPGQQIVLTRRDGYWGETPAVTSATYLFRSDPSVRAAMVATGEADLAPSISQNDANDPETDFSYLNSETVYLRLDHSVPPMNDVRVRKALKMGIDREAFIGTVLADGTELATALVPPTTTGWNPDVVPTAYDPEGAAALLEEAKADGVPVDVPIKMILRNGNFPGVTEVGEAIAQMLTGVGFNIDLQFVEVASHEEYYSKPFPTDAGPYMLMAMHDNDKGDPVFTMFFKYDSEGRQSGTADPKVDEMIAAAQAAVGEERARLWSELIAYLYDDIAADVPLFHTVGFTRVGKRLDFEPTIATNSQLQLSQIGFK